MGCCVSSPHEKRRYRDPADLDEEIVPLRYFGTLRNADVLVPDDIPGLPSVHILDGLASNADPILYEAEIDQGQPFRCFRPIFACCLTPFGAVYFIAHWSSFLRLFTCDESLCWLRKEYSTRRFFRVYSNRIEINTPSLRIPWALFGCGSWNGDKIISHPFDRGAFGFRKVNCGVINYLCCAWPLYGGVVARQRCQCFGPLWPRMFVDCNGWWCDEWPCDIMCCTYRYYGLADADEVSFASSIALQAYFEGRSITKEDVDRCIEYWKEHISEQHGGPRRDVCCEPHCKMPCCDCSFCYTYICHPRRRLNRFIPNAEEEDPTTAEMEKVYKQYDTLRLRQIESYRKYHGGYRSSTLCRKCGCRRFFGRKGCCFCTEGCACSDCNYKKGDPAPPFPRRDVDDENDASIILQKVLGDPPPNVVYRRWRYKDDNSDALVLTTVGPHGKVVVEEGDTSTTPKGVGGDGIMMTSRTGR